MFELPQLPFSKDSMPDFCSAETFDFHYGKHHASYVTKLNTAIEGTNYVDKDLIEVIKTAKAENNLAIFNNAAQHFNHSFFWDSLSPDKHDIGDKLMSKIKENFDSLENFNEKFTALASTLFGSGWAWLVENSEGKLEIVQTHNADTPITDGKNPLLTIDVWEHAYYIDFRNARPNFIAKFWDHVNWTKVEERMK
ncbi:MAG: superoxide dismutase [Fe] [Candidatus Magasanikbacteria bacterium CG_4_10_14_0_8_um_filter_32_14]|uniref:Superoxide dismutase n=2 Tax=Candidatus Magasanikiibacteriota TaxID=1752731 RepID=A0A2M7RA01_9BACT|nr:MAG: superoxide dismutase [Candidatus Magasanikbacteria bacterium CG1_02_32_51]PIY93391.1 MAG: superoxide dismutase [Fe] [Candidatus Magasanikbacteria bacterium CG_4_10_14_0_8_um_filter_32_14]